MARNLNEEVLRRVVNALRDLSHELRADGVEGVLPAEHVMVEINGAGSQLNIHFFGEAPVVEVGEVSEPEMVDESPTVILDVPPVASKKKTGG